MTLTRHTMEGSDIRSTKINITKVEVLPKIGDSIELIVDRYDPRGKKIRATIQREVLDIMRAPKYIRILTRV